MQNLKDYFQAEQRKELVSTLLYQVIPTHRESNQVIDPPKIIFGSGHIIESLLGLKFQISPDAFFQVNSLYLCVFSCLAISCYVFQCNTLAAEVLYSTIARMLDSSFCKESNIETDKNINELPRKILLFHCVNS